MKKNSKFNISIILLIISALSLSTAVYAWFIATGGRVNDIIIKVGEVNASVNLYKVDDFNSDGIIDEPNTDTLLESYPYMMENLYGGSTITFRLQIKNLGTTDNTVKFNFNKLDVTNDKNKLARVMSIQFFIKEENINNLVAQSTPMLLHKDSYTEHIELNFDTILSKGSTQNFYFQLKFEDLETLKSLNDAFSEYTNLNQFQTTSFVLPQFVVRIEQVSTVR